jgi:hypothetical protein
MALGLSRYFEASKARAFGIDLTPVCHFTFAFSPSSTSRWMAVGSDSRD